ncbi:MAG: HupE/UreJ family protein [Candidatus Puniceispirillales bacterium]
MRVSLYAVVAVFLAVLSLGPTSPRAHEVNPAVVEINLGPEQARLQLSFNAEVFLAGIDASITTDTNESPNADDYDRLRAFDAASLQQVIRDNAGPLLEAIGLRSGSTALDLTITDIDPEKAVDPELARLTVITATAPLPPGDDPVVVQLAPRLGAYIIRQQAAGLPEDELYTDFIAAGLESLPIPRREAVERSWQEIFTQYIVSGIAHIIPKGLDHIVFIMGLYFFSPRWRPLLMQVTVFTLAHSVTLALATLGLIRIPASVVEPLIALSIAWIGVENILRPKIGLGRLTVIFGFGLLHGLGFAFVLGEVGLAGSAFALSLVAFNIGVEVGQLLVLAPLLVLGLLVSHRKGYRQRLEIPASAMIALVGMYWFIERVFG